MSKTKLIALIGESGSGKDSLLHWLVEDIGYLNKIVSYTTRPKREGEQEGKDYFYITEKEFIKKVRNKEMLEYAKFNGWYYGTAKSSLIPEKSNVGVFNPAGIRSLLKFTDEIELKVFYIYASDKTRLIRQLQREEDPNIQEILRRYNTDTKDFQALNFEYEIINNNKNIIDAEEEIVDKTLKFIYDKS